MFWKKKPVYIDCYTSNAAVFEYFKPDYGSKFMPEWWHNLKIPEEFNKKNMKGCAGLIDFYRTSIVLPLWDDIQLSVKDGVINWNSVGTPYQSDNFETVEFHDPDQKGEFLTHGIQCKLVSPWFFRSEEDINFLFSVPVWSFPMPDKIVNLPGVLNFKFQRSTNVNLIMHDSSEGYNVELLSNTPITVLHPMTDRPIKLRHHLVSSEELFSKVLLYPSQRFSYFKGKKFLENRKSKCPFGFGGK